MATKTKKEIGKASRNKGKRGELEIVKILKVAGFEKAQRSAQCKGNTVMPQMLKDFLVFISK